jgi:hypothetical protein
VGWTANGDHTLLARWDRAPATGRPDALIVYGASRGGYLGVLVRRSDDEIVFLDSECEGREGEPPCVNPPKIRSPLDWSAVKGLTPWPQLVFAETGTRVERTLLRRGGHLWLAGKGETDVRLPAADEVCLVRGRLVCSLAGARQLSSSSLLLLLRVRHVGDQTIPILLLPTSAPRQP